jgi:hypothetical protein
MKHTTTYKERQIKRLISWRVEHQMKPQLKRAIMHERKMKRSPEYRKAYEEHLKKQAEQAKTIEV